MTKIKDIFNKILIISIRCPFANLSNFLLTYSPTILISYFVFIGCAMIPEEKLIVETKPIEEKLIWATTEKRPQWLEKEPYKEKDNLLFVGISDKSPTEKDSRESAMRAAVNNVVRYIGVDVKDKFERIQTSYGLSTDIIDPTIATRRFEEQFSEAVARRVKAKEWYIEKYERKYRKFSEIYYLAYVLAFVPESEVNREINSQLQYQEELSKAAKSALDKLRQANDLMIDAERVMASQPVQAFGKLRDAVKLAETVKSDIADFSELSAILKRADELLTRCHKNLSDIQKDPEAVFNAAVLGLIGTYAQRPLEVVVAKVNYQDTDMSSKFSEYLAEKLELVLSKEPSLYKVISQRIFQKNLQEKRISIEDLLEDKDAVKRFIPLKALVFARYWLKNNTVECKIDLLELGTGHVIGSTSVDLPKNMFPPGIDFVPLNIDIAKQALKIFGSIEENKDFKIKVWPDKGEGAVYKEGEDIVFHFRANKDCYVYLYHADSEGNVKQLFPNSFTSDNFVKANRIYSIPSEAMNFSFRIVPPFGSEVIKAVASLQPIKGIDTSVGDEIFKSVGKVGGADERNIRSITRAISVIPKEARAESFTIITTVK